MLLIGETLLGADFQLSGAALIGNALIYSYQIYYRKRYSVQIKQYVLWRPYAHAPLADRNNAMPIWFPCVHRA